MILDACRTVQILCFIHDDHWNLGPFDVFWRHQLHGESSKLTSLRRVVIAAGFMYQWLKKAIASLIEGEVIGLYDTTNWNHWHRLV